jgi:hypothetical protein
VAVHVALPDKTPSEQEYVPLPVWTYPGVLHVGAHELPLAMLDVHVPRPPLAGAVTAHGFAPHTAVSVSAPAEHDRPPASVYLLLHVGVHDVPLARLDVHVPKAPFEMAPRAQHRRTAAQPTPAKLGTSSLVFGGNAVPLGRGAGSKRWRAWRVNQLTSKACTGCITWTGTARRGVKRAVVAVAVPNKEGASQLSQLVCVQ